MKRPLRPDEVKVWVEVASTVRPARGRTLPTVPDAPAPAPPPVAKANPALKAVKAAKAARAAAKAASPPAHPIGRSALATAHAPRHTPEPLEPRRQRRLGRERDPIEARLDLHGLDQFAAEDQLKAFLRFAQTSGLRAVLVITGKGLSGDGVIRRRAPEWLAEASLRGVVAGVSQAHRRHGGEGALYVAIKRLAPPDR